MDQGIYPKHIKKTDGGFTCIICDEQWISGEKPKINHDSEPRHKKAVKELRLVAQSLKPEERSELFGLEKRTHQESKDQAKSILKVSKMKKISDSKIPGLTIEDDDNHLPLTKLPLTVRLRPTGNPKKSLLLEELPSTQAVELPFISEAKPLPSGNIRPYSEMIKDFDELKFESYKSGLKERMQAIRSKIEQNKAQKSILIKPS